MRVTAIWFVSKFFAANAWSVSFTARSTNCCRWAEWCTFDTESPVPDVGVGCAKAPCTKDRYSNRYETLGKENRQRMTVNLSRQLRLGQGNASLPGGGFSRCRTKQNRCDAV